MTRCLNRMFRLLLPAVLGIAVLTATTPAHATRPYLFVESAVPLDRGMAKIEGGLSYAEWARGDRIYAMLTEFSYSLYANLDLELEVPYAISGAGGQPFEDSLGDLQAKAKINFVKGRYANPLALSGQIGVKFPTGSGVTTSDEADVRIAGLATKPFGPVTVHGNLSYTFVGDDGALDLNDIVGFGIGIEVQTALAGVQGLGELIWEESRTPGGDDRVELMGGMRHPLSDRMILDASVNIGLTSGAPNQDGAADYGISIGLTYLFRQP